MTQSQRVRLARALRHRQTEAEKLLWRKLSNRQLEGFKFRRQQVLGNYIVDFICMDKKLIVEIDGGQHNEGETISGDKRRTV